MTATPKLVLVTTTIVTLCCLIFLNQYVIAKSSSSIKVDEILTLHLTNKMQNNAALIAWTYGGKIYRLDNNLNVTNKLVNYRKSKLYLSNVIQVSNSLFIRANRYINGDEIEDMLIQFDLNSGKEKDRWLDSKYDVWSISSNKNTFIAMLIDGKQLKLTSAGFQETVKRPRSSHYIATNKQEPIICVEANETKQNWKPAYCFREGKYHWKKIGDWKRLITPFICNNYLIENNPKFRRKPASITIRDIKTGKEISKESVEKISSLSCNGDELVLASKSSISIRQLPSLEIVRSLTTTSREIKSVVMIDKTVYWVDEKRKIQKRKIQ